ncbi:MAG: radical SAM protein [Deltaproteobacteria bacterium]|nr:radical SAM protein [Deltaproteobacteria bacterium]
MRSELVVTHHTCNQRCGHCTARRSEDERAWVQTRAVLARVREAAARGARELVLTGGEPAMRTDLAALVAGARAAGVARVALETNATLIDGPRAAALRAAGLDLARVNLTAWGDALDAITQDPGGWERTLRGVDALLAAGVAVELSAVVVRATAATLPALPAAAVERFGGALQGLVLRVPVRSPDEAALVSYDEAARVIEQVALEGRRVGLAVRLAPEASVPPCVFARPTGVAHLYAMTAGLSAREGHQHLEACGGCAVRDRCAGFDGEALRRWGAPPMWPVTEERVRRRLSVISSVQEQVARELVQPNRNLQRGEAAAVDEDLIRVNFHCNQACRFCFVSTHLPTAGDAQVRDAIARAGREGHWITLTGGEPTLHPRLVDYVALARALSPHPVGLQTNATRLADPARVEALVAAGLRRVFVSLHASDAALSDAITEAPGTFAQTLLGLDALHAQGALQLVIQCVVTRRNHHDLVDLVGLIAARWPRAEVGLAFVAPSSDMVPRDRELIPQYRDVVPSMEDAVRAAGRLGLSIGGFASMCGVPLCLVSAEARTELLEEIPEGYDGGEFVHPPACEGCSLRRRCYGVRRGYLALYGADELRPLP